MNQKKAYWIVGVLISLPGFYLLYKSIGWRGLLGVSLLIWSNNVIEFLAKREPR